MFTRWQAITLWKRVFVGLLIGVLIGLALHYGLGARGADIATTWFKPFGDAFVFLIKMLIVPLIVTTLIAGVIAMGDPKRLGSLGARTIGMYLLTTFFAVWLGLLVATLFQPGSGMSQIIESSAGASETVADKPRNLSRNICSPSFRKTPSRRWQKVTFWR